MAIFNEYTKINLKHLTHVNSSGNADILDLYNDTFDGPSGRSPAETMSSNPNAGMDVCLLWVLCVVK